jgi:hypothetical protein
LILSDGHLRELALTGRESTRPPRWQPHTGRPESLRYVATWNAALLPSKRF